jgi:hypothetical protein
MQCSVAAGQQRAAQESLAVSEASLQRIKQQGCGTTRRDRNIMRLPNLSALPWPRSADAMPEEELDVNARYTAAAQSVGFTQPFLEDPAKDGALARGSALAATGDLAALSETLFAAGAPDSRLYQRIAEDIRGSAPPAAPPAAPAPTAAAPAVYGQAREISPDFSQRCRRHVRAALYDLLHYSDLKEEQLRAEGCSSRLWYVASRGGRLPYLLFLLTLVLLATLLLLRLRSP